MHNIILALSESKNILVQQLTCGMSQKTLARDSENLKSVKKTLQECLNLNSLPIIFREILVVKCWEIQLIKLLY